MMPLPINYGLSILGPKTGLHRNLKVPRTSSGDTLTRQWRILQLLPRGGRGITARELAERLRTSAGIDITKRTVERDLQALSTLFPIACNDKARPYGWHWMKDAHFDLPVMDLTEALTLTLVEDYLLPILPDPMLEVFEPQFRTARRKLAALEPKNPAARWPRYVRALHANMPLRPPSIERGVVSVIHLGLIKQRQIEVDYDAIESGCRSLVLHPLALVLRGPISYLVATAFDYDDIRLYAIHRIQSAALTDRPAHRPADFDLDRYIQEGGLEFGSGATIHFKAEVSEELARILHESPLTDDMEITVDDGRILIEATLPDTWQLRWWILSQGARIRILAPMRLRNEIAAELDAAATHYHDKG